jgi:DNA-binding NarL/FixJ family response regulator
MLRNRKVLIVEDEPLIRSLLASKLSNDGFWVATAANSAEARKLSDESDPDLALLDIELGQGPNGLDLAAILRERDPGIAIVFLTHLPEPRLIGASKKNIPKNAAYLLKDRINDPGVLNAAIEAALRDRVALEFRDDRQIEHRFSKVSNSQLAVLQMVAQGLSNAEIASQRGTTIRAVENLVKRASEAAGIENSVKQNMRVAAAREYIKIAGLTNPKKL